MAAEDKHPMEVEMSEWRVQQLASEAGLMRQEVNDVCFETNGTAWIAASDGLYRYNGYVWKSYSIKDGIPSPFVRSVLFTRSGKLWVGTDRGAGVFNGQQFTYHGADHGLAGPSVRRMYEDPDGTIWFCSDTWPDASAPSGLTSLSPDGRWTVYRESDGLPSRHVFSYFRSAKGDQFAMTGNGVAMRHGNRWLPAKGILETSDETPGPTYMAELPNVGLVCVYKGSLMNYQNTEWRAVSGSIFPLQNIAGFGPVFLPWTASSRGEILKLSSSGKGPLRIYRWNGSQFEPISPPIARPVMVNCIVEAPDGAIWCAGAGLLARWDRFGGEWKEFVNLPSPKYLEDGGGVLFSEGKRTYSLRGSAFESVTDYQEAGNVGENGSGWTIAHGEAWRIHEGKIVQKTDTTRSGIQQGQLLIEDRLGALWFVGADAEGKTRVSVYSGTSWQPINAPELPDCRLMRKDGRIAEGEFISSALTADPHGGIWLVLIKPNNPNALVCRVTSSKIKTYPLNYPRMGSLVVAPDGQVFACGSGGTYRLDLSLDQWQPVVEIGGNLIRAAVQRGEELWCISDAITGGRFGISLYFNGKWTHYFLPVMDYLGKTCDGTLYFAGRDCLYFIPTNSIGPPKRLSILQGHQPTSVLKDLQGRLWIGLADTDEERVLCYTPNGVAPKTIIKEFPAAVRLDDNFRPIVAGIERYARQNQQKTFLYSWRFDKNAWCPFQDIPAEGFPIAGLSVGSHVFQIRAQDEGGDTDPSPAAAGFVVLAIPLQERTWFKPALIAIGTIILSLSILAAGLARRTAALFGDLFENAPVAYHELDRENRLRRVNSTELKMLGYSRREMLGYKLSKFVVEEDAERFLAEQMSEVRATQTRELNLRRKDGSLLPVLMEDRLIRRRDGSIVGIRSTLQDITTRKQAETELLRMHEELSRAHLQLKELNEQLKMNVGVQIIARQQAETEFAVISAERNRVARELHDTLEQTLAGIALRMDAIKDLMATAPELACRQLESAGVILRQSQMEVRRTVWGLRALALERSDLTQALKTIARQISESTAIQVQVQTVGEVSRIPKSIESHLLRIGQEAIANALKHGHARVITIRLAFETGRLMMRIQDDGCGFDLDHLVGSTADHSGLLGMRARIQEIGGQLSVNATLGAGTTIEVNVSLDTKESCNHQPQLG